jgi:hypothetical protein
MPNSIEDILVCIRDEPDHDEHTSWGEWFVKWTPIWCPLATTPRQSECGSGGHSGTRTWGRSLATALRT